MTNTKAPGEPDAIDLLVPEVYSDDGQESSLHDGSVATVTGAKLTDAVDTKDETATLRADASSGSAKDGAWLPIATETLQPTDSAAAQGASDQDKPEQANRRDQSTTNDGPKSVSPPLTIKEMLLAMTEGMELWHDPEGDAYATVKLKRKSASGHDDIEAPISAKGIPASIKLSSKQFKDYLCWRSYETFGCVPSTQALDEVLRALEAKAKYEGAEYEIRVRVGGDSSTCFLHLADEDGSIVRTSADGLVIMQGAEALEACTPAFRFLSKPGMRPIPIPLIPKDIDEAIAWLNELRPFCNVKDDHDWLLLLCLILSAFRPQGPFVVVLMVGEQGSGKSTACKIFCRLIDPSKTPLRSFPREERDLWIAANNSWLICFDNASDCSHKMSDALCRLATGGGNSYRSLYENDALTLFQAQRMVLLNTIDDLALRGDLVDRSIRIYCPRIDATNRRTEAEFWAEFEKNEPKFLGALLFVLSKALGELPNIRMTASPRMADFAKFGVAVEKALQLPEDTFITAYGANRKQLTSAAVDGPLSDLVSGLQLPLEMTATELRHHLHNKLLVTTDNEPRWFPSNPQQLSSQLRRLAPFLSQRGISIEFKHSGTSKILITQAQVGAA